MNRLVLPPFFLDISPAAALTGCDIVFDCEYGYLQMLSDNFATIDFIDNSQFVADMQDPTRKYMPVDRYSGYVIVNTQVLADKGLPVPQSYEDLLGPMYKGLIEMPDPTASSTGYLFLKSLVNAWGEEKALAYFDQLDANILQYTGGSAPVKDAAAGECAIALSPTFKAVDLINEGSPPADSLLRRRRALYPRGPVHPLRP